MKKISFLFSIFILVTAFTCENEPLEGDFSDDSDLSCEIASQNTQDAAIAFLDVTDETYTQLCIAYRNALEVQMQFCGDSDGSLQTQINSLGDCGAANLDPCETVTISADQAEIAYNEDTSNATLCNTYKTALEIKVTVCGDSDGSIQAIIDSLDCSTGTGGDADIVGTWLLTAWIGEEAIDLNNDGTESENFFDEMECYENETLVFNVDNTGVNMSTSFASFMFEIEVGTTNEYDYTIECELENENINFTWTQNGSNVTVNDGTSVLDYTLNGNQLSVFIPEGFTAFSSDFTATTSQDLTFIYTKQ